MSVALLKSAILLIHTLFGLYVFILLIRFLLTLRSPLSQYNPLARFVSTLTDPPLSYLYKYIPPIRHFDLSALLLLYCIELLKQFLLLLIHTSGTYSYISIYAHLLFWPVSSLLSLTIKIYFWSIIVSVILSWLMLFKIVRLNPNNPFYVLISELIEPLIAPFQRLIPPINGLDLSPLLALLALEIARFFVQLLPLPTW